MGEYNIQQMQFISAYRNSHKVPVMLSDDAVVDMIKEEMIKSGKIYPEFASLLDKGGKSKNGKNVSVFETMRNSDFVSERLDKIKQTANTESKHQIETKKTYLPQERAVARRYIAAMLKNQIQEAIFGENGFNMLASPNKISGSEAWQELEVLGASVVHNLHLGQLGIEKPLNRVDLAKDLNTAYRQIEELEALVDNPKAFDKKYKEITHYKNEMDYSAVIDYLRAVDKHQSAYMQDKLSTLEELKKPAERFEKTLNIPAVKNFNKWAGRQETGGSLTGLAIDMALVYMSGGMTAASSVAMKTGEGVTRIVTEQAIKTGIKRETAEIVGQAAGITASQVTVAGLNSGMFQATRIAGALEDGNFTSQEFEELGASYVGLFKFVYVGSAISGPMGAKFGEWVGRLINNEKTIPIILNSSLKQPTTLGKVLTNLSEHTGIIQKAAEFSTSFAINTEYMALDEGISFEEALKNLAQMEGVSKMVMAFLGGKTTKFLTPEKVQKITTELENCKVEIAVYKGHKAIKVTTADGKENFFSSHEELITFVADKIYTEAGVKTGVNNGVKPEVKSEPAKKAAIAQTTQSQAEPVTYEKAVSTISEKLQGTTNVSDIMPFLDIIKENKESHFNFESDRDYVSFYDKTYNTRYRFEFDGQGKIIKYFKEIKKADKKTEDKLYIYDKTGHQTEVTRDEYKKIQPEIRTDELRNYIITNPDLLPKETRDLLLQDINHFYTKEDVDEFASMLKTQEDIAIANKLLNTRGNEHRAIRAIGDALNLSQQKFGLRDIMTVLKHEKAKAMVLDCIKENKYVKKTKLVQQLGDDTFASLKTCKIADEADISYRTKDINISNIDNVVHEYQTNPQLRSQINEQVPDGEAACINGKMYCRAGENLVPIALDKATFERLFPVEERYNISQGNIGDCYFIAELGGYAATPNGRAALYNSFRQEGSDIIIKFPQFKNIEIKFENGELNKLCFRSLYKYHGKWTIGHGNAHVQACDGIKMIEQAYSFVRNSRTDDNMQIVANDKFLMHKQMQDLEGSRTKSGEGAVPSLFRNYENLTSYRSSTFTLDGARTVEEGLEVLSKELETNPNAFGSASFDKNVSIDVDEGLKRGHQYRIIGYDKDRQIVKIVDPNYKNEYKELPLEIFKAGEPDFSVFKLNPPKVKEGGKPEVKPEPAKQTEKTAAKAENAKTEKQKFMTPEERKVRISKLDNAKISSDAAKEIDALIFEFDNISKDNPNERSKNAQNIQNKINTLRMTDPEEADKLQLIFNTKVKNPKASDVSDEMIALATEHLIRQYEVVEADMTQFIKDMGFEKFGHYESRIKSDTSLFDKISNYLKDHPDETFADAINDVRDCYGGRFVLDFSKMMNDPEVVKLVNQGKIGEAKQLAAEKTKDELVKLFRTQAEKNPDMFYRVSNYVTKEGNGLFDEAHLFEMRRKDIGSTQKGLDCVVLSTDEEVISKAKKKSTKSQRSGYCAFQVNLWINGRSAELQFQTVEVHKVAKSEHWIYDMVTGKDIVGRTEKLEEFVSPLRTLVLGTMPIDVYEQYYAKYTSAWYNWAELKAEGKETPPEPKLQDYAPEGTTFDYRLSMKNVNLFDKIAGRIKNKGLPVEEGIKEYNERLSDDDTTD